MKQFKCINRNCDQVIYCDSDPKDVCSTCADIISGDAMRGERYLSLSDVEEYGL